MQNPHSHLDKIRDVNFHFNDHRDALYRDTPTPQGRHRGLRNARAPAPASWGVWLPLMRCVREKLPELRQLRIFIDAPSFIRESSATRFYRYGEFKGDGFVETLEDWEREGYGWVTEQEGGCIYLESRKAGNVLGVPRRKDGFM